MEYFDRIIDRKGTSCIKYDDLFERFGSEDLLPMWVADMDFSVPKCISEAIKERAEHDIYGYTFRDKECVEAFIEWCARRHNWDVSSTWVTSSPGVVTGLALSILALSDKGDKILVQPPVYFPFFEIVRDNNRRLVESPLIFEEGKYSMDFEDLERKFAGGIKLMILCSPHNPVGRVWTREELTRLGELCLKYDVLLISDEIHADLILPGNKHIPIASLSKEIGDITITAMAPSKTFNVAGLSSSIIVIQNQVIKKKYDNMLNSLHLGLGNIFGHVAIKAGYKGGDQWLDELMIYIKKNVDFTRSFLREKLPKVKLIEPDSTFLLWLDFSDYDISNEDLNKLFISKGKLALNNGTTFGMGGEGFFRLNIGCSQNILKDALDRIVISLD